MLHLTPDIASQIDSAWENRQPGDGDSVIEMEPVISQEEAGIASALLLVQLDQSSNGMRTLLPHIHRYMYEHLVYTGVTHEEMETEQTRYMKWEIMDETAMAFIGSEMLSCVNFVEHIYGMSEIDGYGMSESAEIDEGVASQVVVAIRDAPFVHVNNVEELVSARRNLRNVCMGLVPQMFDHPQSSCVWRMYWTMRLEHLVTPDSRLPTTRTTTVPWTDSTWRGVYRQEISSILPVDLSADIRTCLGHVLSQFRREPSETTEQGVDELRVVHDGISHMVRVWQIGRDSEHWSGRRIPRTAEAFVQDGRRWRAPRPYSVEPCSLDLPRLELEALTKASEETRLGCQLLEKLEQDGEEIPPELSCPIKGWGVVWDPVLWADGHTYERLQLELYMRIQASGYVKSPVTNEVFKRTAPIQNIAVKKGVASRAVTRAREICKARNMPHTGLSDAALLKRACSAVGCSVEAPFLGKVVDPPSDDSDVEYASASASPSSQTRTDVHGLRAYYETMAARAGLSGRLAREARPPERGGLTPPQLREGVGVEDEDQENGSHTARTTTN